MPIIKSEDTKARPSLKQWKDHDFGFRNVVFKEMMGQYIDTLKLEIKSGVQERG